MRVVVIGAGMGGLVLAQGLRAAGVEVRVHERDADLTQTGGYRLHLGPEAVSVLRRRLPAPVFQAVLASGAGSRSFRRFGILDHRLRPLARLPRGDDGEHLMIGRSPLRRLLGHDLAEVIRFGSEFTGLEHNPDGTVTATFAGGTRERADVLVGADGARSRVVAALTGAPTARRLDAFGLAGKAPLNGMVRMGAPAALHHGPAFAVAPNGTTVFLTLHDPATAPIDARACQEVPAIVEPGYALWGVIVPAAANTPADTTGGVEALRSARRLLTGFAPWVHTLLDHSDPAQVNRFPYYAADPDSDLTPWRVQAVTALGDAVHAMPPTGGQGAATAIRDADLLIDHLARIGDQGPADPADGDDTVREDSPVRPIALALYEFQQAMTRQAVPALRESLRPLRWQQRLTSPLGRRLLPTALAITGMATTPCRTGKHL